MLSKFYLRLVPPAEAVNTAWSLLILVFDPSAIGLPWNAMGEPAVIYRNGVYHTWFRYSYGGAQTGYMNSTDGQNCDNLTCPVIPNHAYPYLIWDDAYGFVLTACNMTSGVFDIFNSSEASPNNWNVIKYSIFPSGGDGEWDHQYMENSSITYFSEKIKASKVTVYLGVFLVQTNQLERRFTVP